MQLRDPDPLPGQASMGGTTGAAGHLDRAEVGRVRMMPRLEP